jgi:1,2-diacylglycerol 3-beta-galactosyltransferase
MAQAISEALLELDPNVAVSAVNVFSSECSAFPLTLIPRLYAKFTTGCPPLWYALYYSTDGHFRYTSVERLVQPFIRPRLRLALHNIRPDVIVSVFPALGYALHSATQELGWHIPLGIVVADLVSIHHAWLFRKATWYAVPTHAAQQVFLAAGVDAKNVHVLGLPIKREFLNRPADEPGLRQRLGLPAHHSVVLITSGGEGTGRLEELVEMLLRANLPCHLVVVTGRNERLRHRLLQKTPDAGCHILGYVTNMAEWMWASDVLVTRAGPSTIAEAVHCGLPMVIHGAIPGQEEGNVSFVKAEGLGIIATQPREVTDAVTELLTNQAAQVGIKSRMRRLQRPKAALAIADLILQ